MFPEFTELDIEEFKKTYIGSKDEADDIIEAFNQHKGDMHKVMECVPFAESDQVDRLIKQVKLFMHDGRLSKKFNPKFLSSCKTLKQDMEAFAAAEAKEAEIERKKRVINQ